MIIISKYKDYYDSACYGETDPKRIWNRPEPSWCNDKIFKCSKTSHLPIIVSDHDCFHVELRIIGFCGKIYPAVVAHDAPDKIKAESHWFDKYSFRKQKENV